MDLTHFKTTVQWRKFLKSSAKSPDKTGNLARIASWISRQQKAKNKFVYPEWELGEESIRHVWTVRLASRRFPAVRGVYAHVHGPGDSAVSALGVSDVRAATPGRQRRQAMPGLSAAASGHRRQRTQTRHHAQLLSGTSKRTVKDKPSSVG